MQVTAHTKRYEARKYSRVSALHNELIVLPTGPFAFSVENLIFYNACHSVSRMH